MRQIFFAFVIEEFPKHINREQRVIILRPEIVNKPLEALDFIATVILDKVKHTALVGIKRRGDVFQEQGGIGVYREDIHHLFVGDTGHRLYQLTGFLRSGGKVPESKLPIFEYGFILVFLHSCTHELECDIFGQTD